MTNATTHDDTERARRTLEEWADRLAADAKEAQDEADALLRFAGQIDPAGTSDEARAVRSHGARLLMFAERVTEQLEGEAGWAVDQITGGDRR